MEVSYIRVWYYMLYLQNLLACDSDMLMYLQDGSDMWHVIVICWYMCIVQDMI